MEQLDLPRSVDVGARHHLESGTPIPTGPLIRLEAVRPLARVCHVVDGLVGCLVGQALTEVIRKLVDMIVRFGTVGTFDCLAYLSMQFGATRGLDSIVNRPTRGRVHK